MRARSLPWIGGLALALAAAPQAFARIITYDFTITGLTGPLAGVTENGSFSYDSSSVVPGGANTAIGLLTGLSFSWSGISYNETTANTGALEFNGAGVLTVALIGSACGAGFCVVNPGTDSWSGFFRLDRR